MLALGIETSCDETAVAAVKLKDGSVELIGQKIASQVEKHRPYGGVVPELATRQHLVYLESLTQELFKETGLGIANFDGIAVTRGPGLATALLIGLGFGKGLALASGKPWVGVNHLEGHLFSAFMERGELPQYPHVALIVSGGHTQLILARGAHVYEILGSTRDDAAGEAFDKVAKLLGLSYPGGPMIEKLAKEGDCQAVDFPRPMLDSGDLNFSFSGLKTAVRVWVSRQTLPLNDKVLRDVCASFQKAVVDVLVGKARRACLKTGVRLLTLSGGVSCNQALSGAFESMAREEGVEFKCASRGLSTDNAAMIAIVGGSRLMKGEVSEWGLDVDPSLRLMG
jgi:N6-L-threonylcarbamoyladenine synthase